MRKPRALLCFAALVALSLAGLGGCSLPTKITAVSPDIPREAPPIAIKSGLEALDDAENKKRLEHILASAEMKAVEKEMAAGLLDASLTSLDDPARQKHISEISEKYARGLMGAMSSEMSSDVGPMARSIAQNAVRGALDEAMGQQHGVGGPNQEASVRGILREQLAPAIADMLKDPEFKKAFGDLARVMGREAVVGATEGFKQSQAEAPPEHDSLLGRVTSIAKHGVYMMSTLTWVLGFVVLLLAVWITKLTLQVRRVAKGGTVRTVVESDKPLPVVAPPRRAARSATQPRFRARARLTQRHVVPRSTH